MVDNVKSIKEMGEKAMDELISRFTFNVGSLAQKTNYDSIKNKESDIFLKTIIKRIQLLQKRKISLLVKYYYVMTNAL